MRTRITYLLKLIFSISVFICVTALSSLTYAENNTIKNFGWGGGGAFTGTALLNGEIFLSSDVAGVWKQVDGQWQPFVDGLANYNVTSLASFNNKLFAITSDELFETDGTKGWTSTNITLSTYRGTTLQPYSISQDAASLCIASGNKKIDCIDSHFESASYSIFETIVNGVYFDLYDSNTLYYFSGTKLYSLNLTTNYNELLTTFNHKIVSIAKYNNKILIATSKRVYDMSKLGQTLYEASSSSIVNFFVASHYNSDIVFIGRGETWGIYPMSYMLVDDELIPQHKLQINFDLSLPHRPYQTRLNKLLGVSNLDGNTWVTDYWGVYKLNIENVDGVPELLELTASAVNTVATDLVITDDNFYISTMDNGIVKMKRTNANSTSEYQALAFDRLQGHAWSLLQDNNNVHGVISPWNNPNDFLFSYNENEDSSTIVQLTDYTTRNGEGAFWGQGYARQLVDFNGIVTVRDGVNGGLVSDNSSDVNPIENTSLNELGGFNRVYRSIAVNNGLLYIASCEGAAMMMAVDEMGQTVLAKALPTGFCPFSAYTSANSFYLLGVSNGSSVIYQYKNGEFSLLVSKPIGSAFYQMAINPLNELEIVVGTISWSNKATSGLFVSNDGGLTFTDKSCLLSHKNGVVALKFDDDTVYILQKVGGGRAVPSAMLFSVSECGESLEDITVDVINFNQLFMQAYDSQDTSNGSVSVEDDGTTLKMHGNRWRAAKFDYTITPNTVIEFDFKTSSKGEIHGIGLDNNLLLNAKTTFNLFGTQAFGRQKYRYSGSGDYERISIPIGQYYTGNMHYLFFAMDQDVVDPTANSYFRNVKVVER